MLIIWEACKILWKHKKVFFAFAALPMVLNIWAGVTSAPSLQKIKYDYDVYEYKKAYSHYGNNGYKGKFDMVEPQLPSSEQNNLKWPNPIMNALEFLLGLTLLSIAWFRYILDSGYKLGLKTYWNLNSTTSKYAFFNLLFLMGWFVYIIVFIVTFWYTTIKWDFLPVNKILAPYNYMGMVNNDMLLPAIFLMGIFTVGIPLFIGLYGLLYFISPYVLILPSISIQDNKKLTSFKKSLSGYRIGFFLNLTFLVFAFLLLPKVLMVFGRDFFINHYFYSAAKIYHFFSFGMNILVSFSKYIIIGLILTLLALYYETYMVRAVK